MEEKVLKDGVVSLKEAGERAPEIFGIKTGIEGLDDLFFYNKNRKG